MYYSSCVMDKLSLHQNHSVKTVKPFFGRKTCYNEYRLGNKNIYNFYNAIILHAITSCIRLSRSLFQPHPLCVN